MTSSARRTAHALPPSRHVPGVTADPRDDGRWSVPEVDRFGYGCDLFDAGFFWEAHEVWEARWVDLPEGSLSARYQQALMLVAAALHKQQVENYDGAHQLLLQARRVFQRVTDRRGPVVGGLDVVGLLAATEQAIYGGDLPLLGEVVPLEPSTTQVAVVGPDHIPPPSWPPWVQEWVLPYLSEPALWPVLVALLGHVVVVIVPLMLAVARHGSVAAALALVGLLGGSVAVVRWEWRVHGRPSGVTVAVLSTWLMSLVSAWGADHLGVL